MEGDARVRPRRVGLLIALDGNRLFFAPNFFLPRRLRFAQRIRGARLVATIHDLGWRRVPFTCTWLPGKRPLPLAMLAVLAIIWVTAAFADIVALTIQAGPRRVATLAAILLVVGGFLRWLRRRSWADRPLEFEDEDPSRMQQLGLGPS